jgi:prepilin-type N-terminal cleavage/methylation domain-containing protein
MKMHATRKSGMTMIETLVVIAILGIFMAIAVPGVVRSFRVMRQVKELTSRYPSAHRAMNRISATVREAYPEALLKGEAFVGRSGVYQAGGTVLPSDELSVPVLDTKYAHLSSVQTVTYQVKAASIEEESLPTLVERRSFFGAAPDTGTEEIIPGGVVGLDFAYLDDAAEPPQWVTAWPPDEAAEAEPEMTEDQPPAGEEVRQSPRLPAAVKITVFISQEFSREPKSFTTIVNVPSH